MQVQILLFATLKDRVGQNRVMLSIAETPTTVRGVRQALVQAYPALAAHVDAAIAAVNEDYAFADDPVQEGDTVAFFPPVSGGDGREYPEIFRLAEEAFSTDELVRGITVPETGAVCVFSGMVRGQTAQGAAHRQTDRLEYEAYAPMALAKMRQVAAEIRERWPLVQGIAIVQRIGVLAVGENTIVIACSSGHRDQGCFEGARYGIDRLKEIVPVWKKEFAVTGEQWVEGHYQPKPDDRT